MSFKLLKWVTLSLAFSQYIAIATTPNLYDDCIHTLKSVTDMQTNKHRVQVVSVSPWHQITPALNALLLHSRSLPNCRFIMFSSVEIACSPQHITKLYNYLDKHTNCLVAGARLAEMDFRAFDGEHKGDHEHIVEINGITTPWNTAALWSRDKLIRTGFLTISDGADFTINNEIVSVQNGMEEVAVISMHQMLYGFDNAEAVVIDVNFDIPNPSIQLIWETDWSDPSRREKHLKKMKSKLDRAHSQLRVMNLKPGKVRHIK